MSGAHRRTVTSRLLLLCLAEPKDNSPTCLESFGASLSQHCFRQRHGQVLVLLQEFFFPLWNLFYSNHSGVLPSWTTLQHALSSPAFVSSVRIGLTEFCLYLITSLLAQMRWKPVLSGFPSNRHQPPLPLKVQGNFRHLQGMQLGVARHPLWSGFPVMQL